MYAYGPMKEGDSVDPYADSRARCSSKRENLDLQAVEKRGSDGV
jgi:hypothetical protein